jgi:mono/diheme cytochrome c family protein
MNFVNFLAPTALVLSCSANLLSAEPSTAPAASAPVSATVFANNCSACHQPQGQGIPGVFPSLAGDAFVKGDPSIVVSTVLSGRNGMPSFRNELDDAQLAAVISFIRSSWGNNAKPVTAQFVAKVRANTNNQRGDRPAQSN